MDVHTAAGQNEGPAFCDKEGFLMATADMNTMLCEGLEEVYANGYTSFFPIAVTDKTKISELIQVYRSCRRTSESRVTAIGVKKDNKKIVNMWSREFMTKGKKALQPLRVSYTDQNLLDECFRRYTKAT